MFTIACLQDPGGGRFRIEERMLQSEFERRGIPVELYTIKTERPPLIAPVLTHAGIRSEPDASLQPHGPDSPRGAHLAAFDAGNGTRLWSALVFELVDDPDWPLSLDMDRRIKSLTLLPDESGLDIEDDSGYHDLFDFATRVARDVSGVPDRAPPKADSLAWATPPATPMPRDDDDLENPTFLD